MKTQVNPVPPPGSGQIRWLRPVRRAHNQFDVQEHGEKGWTLVLSRLSRHDARWMCRNANIAHQSWFERRARIARDIESRKRDEARKQEENAKYEARMRMIAEAERRQNG
jgi:hypothetical protein